MRVIHVVSTISEEAAGPSYSVMRLCEALISEGQDVTLAVLSAAAPGSAATFAKTFPMGVGPCRLGRSPEMRRWLDEQARSRAVDIMHSHGLWMMPNVYPGRVAKQHNLPLVVSPRGMLSAWAIKNGSRVKRVFWPLVQRPALAATACFHATAESEYEDIRRMGFRQPVAVIPNGIDIPILQPRERGAARTLLFLSRIHPKKGLDMLLPAWQAVQDRFPEWRLLIVGPDEGGHLGEMRQLAGRLSLKRIEFAGPLKGKEKWATYQSADLFVLPSYSENFGMAVAEALASGVPVIVSKGAPWPDLEVKGAGWWIDVGVAPLVDCMSHALSKPSLELDAMGCRGRAWMQAEFSWRRIGAMMAETYAWIVKSGETPAWVRQG